MAFLFDDRDHQKGGHGTPDLSLDGIFAGADKFLDAQVLLDPLEEKLHLPSALVKGGNGQGGQGRVVGQKHQGLASIGCFEADASQQLGVAVGTVVPVQRNSWSRITPATRSVGAEYSRCAFMLRLARVTKNAPAWCSV